MGGANMKKAIFFTLVVIFAFVFTACGSEIETIADITTEHTTITVSVTATIPITATHAETTPEINISDDNERCHCDTHYIHEVLRTPTPPLHIRETWGEVLVDEFFTDFETIYETTFIQWDTESYSSLIIWTDNPLRDVMFVSLGSYYHSGNMVNGAYFYTDEILYTVDEFLPGDALVLNVAFVHYNIPRGGLVFTDENGIQKSMVISESMRGGCFPQFSLIPALIG
jgi:hypothetical protein